jgi:hypothetical protein
MSKNLGNNITWTFVDPAPKYRSVSTGNKKAYYMLVNNEGDNLSDVIFGDASEEDVYFYTDWDLDGNGFIRTLNNEDAMIQTTLKCLFTEKQDNGYGSHLYDFVGEKDIGVRRLCVFMDLSMALMTLKSLIDAEAIRQNLNSSEIIASVRNLVVTEDAADISVVRIQLKLLPASGIEVPVTVL